MNCVRVKKKKENRSHKIKSNRIDYTYFETDNSFVA